jgi:tetratricopeptide (TPR) repeat protein
MAAFVLAACLLAPVAARAQQAGNVVLEANEQLFSILAALSAAGYDSGAGAATGSEVREELRAALASRSSAVLPELRQFFAEHQVAGDPGADLGQYVSLALLLGPPPDFHFSVPESDLPPDAKALAGLVPLLRKFYNQEDLIQLWARFQTRQQAEIDRSSDAIRESIARSDAYFGFPSGAYLGRTYTIYLSLLGAPEQVHARIYGMNYYLVVMPSKAPKLEEIRHQYLHFLLDPLAVKYATEINTKSQLKGFLRSAPQLAPDFKEDFPLFVTECLIRAAELRMDKRPKEEAQKSIKRLTAGGLVLAPYFYETLAQYEQQGASLNVVYRDMIRGIDLAQETKKLAALKFAPVEATAAGEPSPARSEEERLLDRADGLIYEGKYREAREAYQQVLDQIAPRSERALFGVAVAASNLRKPDTAQEYFLKTLEVARDLRIVSWSHIYLGRLLDLQGKRQEALSQYRAASLTASSFPDAVRAVQSGMQKPFGLIP